MSVHDVCVIGAGLIGSATAKYLCQNSNQRVCLIGPLKSSRENVHSTDIFDSWSDMSRVVHVLFPDIIWAHLANESIKRFRAIEEESGVKFFTESGYLVISNSAAYIGKNASIGSNVGIANSIQHLSDAGGIHGRFPFLQLPQKLKLQALHEAVNSGIINPRSMVEAQRILVKKYGGIILDDIVDRIEQGSSDTPFKVITKRGTTILANKVVVCAGAFLNHRKLLPDGCQLDVRYKTSLVCRIRIDSGPSLNALMNIPPFIYVHATDDNVSNAFVPGRQAAQHDSPTFGSSIYCVPPILYPDGHHYLKIGFLDDTLEIENKFLNSPETVTSVYRSKCPTAEEKRMAGQQLVEIARRLFKDFHVEHFDVDICCWVNTPNCRPYIGQVAPGWFVVTGDNGLAAKSADEIGRLAAELVLKGKWSCGFPKEDDLQIRVSS